MSDQRAPLFRQEAIDQRIGRNVGGSLLPSETPGRMAALTAILVIVVLVGVATLGHYTRTITATGIIVPSQGVIRLVSKSPQALVKEIRVKEGQVVRQGDLLFVLVDDKVTTTKAGSEASGEPLDSESIVENLLRRERRAALLEKSKQISQAQALADAGKQIDQSEGEIAQLDREISIQSSRVQLAKEQFARHNLLMQQGYVAEGYLSASKADLLEQQSRFEQLLRTKLTLVREKTKLEQARAQLALTADQDLSLLRQTTEELQQQRIERQMAREIVVKAPADGVLTNLLVTEGQVTGSRTLATLIPSAGDLEAQVDIPSKEAGLIAVGQATRIRYSAYPYQRFGQYGGRIASKGESALNSSDREIDAPQAGSQPDDRFYRVRVALNQSTVSDGNGLAKRLSAGDRFEADISVERTSILEWLLQPLRRAAAHVGSPNQERRHSVAETSN